MPVYRISGVGNTNEPTIEVDKDKAELSFLVMVNNNNFSLRDILNSDQGILYGKVKPWYQSQGFDFDRLLLMLKQGS